MKRDGNQHANEKTLSVQEAGRRYFGLGKNASYEAAKRGEIPTIRIGGRFFVPIVALERMLNDCGGSDVPRGHVQTSTPSDEWRRINATTR